MDKLEKIFGRGRDIFLPIIHVNEQVQAIENALIAFDNGADGLLLISMDRRRVDRLTLNRIYDNIRTLYADKPLGVNYLADAEDSANVMASGLDMLWVDHSGVDDGGPDAAAKLFQTRRRVCRPNWLYLGGVAFKYGPTVKDVAAAARQAQSFVDVIVTSGKGTGIPAEIEKIRTMREAVPAFPLGIASGLDPDNVGDFRPYGDLFLVSTGISYPDTDNFNPSLVGKFGRRLGK